MDSCADPYPVYSGKEIRPFGEGICKLHCDGVPYLVKIYMLLRYINRSFIGLFVDTPEVLTQESNCYQLNPTQEQ